MSDTQHEQPSQREQDIEWYEANHRDLADRYSQYQNYFDYDKIRRGATPHRIGGGYIGVINGRLERIPAVDFIYDRGLQVLSADVVDGRAVLTLRVLSKGRRNPLTNTVSNTFTMHWARGPQLSDRIGGDDGRIIRSSLTNYLNIGDGTMTLLNMYPLSFLSPPPDATHVIGVLKDDFGEFSDEYAVAELPTQITRLVVHDDVDVDDVDENVVWSSQSPDRFEPVVDSLNSSASGNRDGVTVIPVLRNPPANLESIHARWVVRDKSTGAVVSQGTQDLRSFSTRVPSASAVGGMRVKAPETVGQYQLHMEFTLRDQEEQRLGTPQCMTHDLFITFAEPSLQSLEARDVELATRWSRTDSAAPQTGVDVLKTLMNSIHSQGWAYSLLKEGPQRYQFYEQLLFDDGPKYSECGGNTRALIYLAAVHGISLEQRAVHDFLTVPGLVSSDGLTGNAGPYHRFSGIPASPPYDVEQVRPDRWFWNQHVVADYRPAGLTFDTTYNRIWSNDSEFIEAKFDSIVSLADRQGSIFRAYSSPAGVYVINALNPTGQAGLRTGLAAYIMGSLDAALNLRQVPEDNIEPEGNNAPVVTVFNSGQSKGLHWNLMSGVSGFELQIDDLRTSERRVFHDSGITTNALEIPGSLGDGEYGAFVRTIGSNGQLGPWSDMVQFSIGLEISPDVPRLSVDDSEMEDRTPTVSWFAVKNAAVYEVELQGVRNGEVTTIENVKRAAESFTPEQDLADGVYWIKARAINSDGVASGWSESLAFRVRDVVLTRPVIVVPESTTRDLRPEISWEPVDGAANYWLFIVDLQTRRWADSATVKSGSSYRPDTDLAPGHYKVIVHARDQNGGWSRLSRKDFSVEGGTPRPERPSVSRPGNVTTERSPRFEWNAVEYAVKYSLRIRNLSTGETNVVQIEDLTSTSYQVEKALPLGRYRVELLAYNKDGLSSLTNEMVAGAHGQVFEFTIEHPAPPDDAPVPEPGETAPPAPPKPTRVELIDRALRVTGSSQDDIVTIGEDGTELVVDVNGDVFEFSRSQVDAIEFTGAAGNDVFENQTDLAGLVDGGAGNDSLHGGSAGDTLLGGAGDDLLIGYHGRDRLDGGEGDDKALGAAHDDTLIGGSGNDFLDGQGSSHDVLIVTGSDAADDITLGRSGVYTAIDSTGGATFSARFRRAEHVTLNTRGGDDSVTAIGIDDAGYFRLRTHLGDGDDSLDFSEADNAQIITVAQGGMGEDTMIGGPGRDRFNGGGGNGTLIGNDGNDTLAGGDGDDLLDGGDGQDRLRGFSGRDTLSGGADRDWLYGGDGDDELDGGDGRDRLLGEEGHDVLRGGSERDTLLGGVGDDSLDGGQSHDALSGGQGNDLLIGSSGHDTLHGADGNDSLYGGTGDDILLGGDGDDAGSGQRGDDTVSGGQGMDAIAALPAEIDEAFQFDAWWLQVV